MGYWEVLEVLGGRGRAKRNRSLGCNIKKCVNQLFAVAANTYRNRSLGLQF